MRSFTRFKAMTGKQGFRPKFATGKPDDKVGNASKQKYQSAIPGLGKVKAKLDHIFQQTKNGYGDAFIPGLDGRRV